MDEKLRDAADYLNNAVRMELKQNKYVTWSLVEMLETFLKTVRSKIYRIL